LNAHVPARLPALLAAPPAGAAPLWLTNARLIDGSGAAPREHASVLVRDGRIQAVGSAGDESPAGVITIDLARRTLMPGLIDAHAHVLAKLPAPADGAESLLPGTGAHVVAAHLAEALRRGVTTIRDVGSYGSVAVEARQAMRLGAFRGPRLLTCRRIVSATSPGGRFFDGMYREADGPDDIRRAVREQLRHGADFIKVMTTGARSVELEDPDPAQLTRPEVAALVEESHRLGYRVAAHAEGLAGTEIAVEEKRRQINETKMAAQIALEQQRATLIESKVDNDRKAADSRAYELSAMLNPLKEIDWRTLMAANASKIDPKVGVAMAFRDLADNAQKIGQLNITPDLLQSLVEDSKPKK